MPARAAPLGVVRDELRRVRPRGPWRLDQVARSQRALAAGAHRLAHLVKVRVRVRDRVRVRVWVRVRVGVRVGVRVRVRVRVSKLDEIEEENYVTQRDVIRELSS